MTLGTCGLTIPTLPMVYCSGVEYRSGAIVSFRLFAPKKLNGRLKLLRPAKVKGSKTIKRRDRTVEFSLIGGDVFRHGAKDFVWRPLVARDINVE